MSGGMEDGAACGRLYVAAFNAVYDVRKHAATRGRRRLCHRVITQVNILIADLGWCFVLAQYAEAKFNSGVMTDERAADLWQAVEALRKALDNLNMGHRGLVPVLDPEVQGVMVGSGYELRRL